jgi:hypothetical protein
MLVPYAILYYMTGIYLYELLLTRPWGDIIESLAALCQRRERLYREGHAGRYGVRSRSSSVPAIKQGPSMKCEKSGGKRDSEIDAAAAHAVAVHKL